MKKIIFVLLFITNYCTAQRAAISLDKMNILYAGIDNPITIAVENYKPSQYKVYTNNGTIEATEYSLGNQFFIRPKEWGKATIYIVINKKDTISKTYYRVKNMPLPNAYVANKPGGKISKNELRAQWAVFAKFGGFDFDYKANVRSYRVEIFNKCAISYSNTIEGFNFTSDLRKEFDKLEKGDWVIFSEIKVHLPNGKYDSISDVLFFEIE